MTYTTVLVQTPRMISSASTVTQNIFDYTGCNKFVSHKLQ